MASTTVQAAYSPPNNIDALTGSALAALVWIVYDSLLVLDYEQRTVWRASWSTSKAFYIFLRCHSLIALGWYVMSAIGNTPFKIHMILPSPADLTPEILAPCIATHQFQLAGRWYIGLTEVTTVLVGEALILIRINALYGWSQLLIWSTLALFFVEMAVGYTTTVIMLLGGAKNLAGSEDILNCSKTASNVPDVNIGMWCTSIIVAFIYFCLLMRKSIIFAQEASYALGAIRHPIGFWNRTLASFGTFWTVLKFSFSNCPEANMAPTVYLCLRDGALYFLVVVTVLVLNLLFSVFFKEFAQVGTPWLIATYTIASTRIFLNLKVSARKVRIHGLGTGTDSWQEFEDMSQLEFNNRQMIRH